MHSCWSPVPKCRPSFQQLVSELETLHLSLTPGCPPLLYVNLEGDEGPDGGGGAQELARSLEPDSSAEASSWSVPWQRRAEEEERDWLVVGSGAARATGGDYRYIIRHCGAAEEEEDRLQEEPEEEDAVINV